MNDQIFYFKTLRCDLLVPADTHADAVAKLDKYLLGHQDMPRLPEWQYVRPLAKVGEGVFLFD